VRGTQLCDSNHSGNPAFRRPSSYLARSSGRYALVFDGEISTGAADDLQRATEIALEMVTRFGMDETVGPRTYAAPPQPFLGTPARHVEASETTEREIDVAARDIVMKAFERATVILRARRADLEDGTRLLLERETLTADQFPAIQRKAKQTNRWGESRPRAH
jgi:cell division protease FtsH